MNCHYCGAEISSRAVFCPCCGTRQQSAPQAETASEPMAEPVAVAAAEPAPVAEAPAVTTPETAPAPRPAPVYQEKKFDWQPYGGAPAPKEPLFDFELAPKSAQPRIQLPTGRSLAKMIIFSILTLGIYPMVIWSRLVSEVNMVASRYDGERSMSFFGMTMLMPFTMGIHSLVWMHKLCRRIGAELQRRSLRYSFGARDFWIWNVLLACLSTVCMGVFAALQYALRTSGSWIVVILLILALLCIVGPLVFTHKLLKSMNLINADFNVNG